LKRNIFWGRYFSFCLKESNSSLETVVKLFNGFSALYILRFRTGPDIGQSDRFIGENFPD